MIGFAFAILSYEKNAYENVVCGSRLLHVNAKTSRTDYDIPTNSVDPDQIAPRRAV